MNTFTVRVDRDEKYWRIRVEEIERTTMTTSLAKVDEVARELISIMTGDPEDSFTLDTHIDLPEDVVTARTQADQLRKKADEANTAAAAKSREAATLLRHQGLTVRDIGEVLGVSYQRAQQLSSDKQPA